MNKIYTLTLSPVLDVHYALDRFTPGTENFAGSQLKIAAGKGVNVSAALLRHGITSPAYLLLGKRGANEYLALARSQGLELHALEVDSQVREYVSVNYPGGETRICYKNFSACDADVLAIGELLGQSLKPGDFLAVSGGLPAGVSANAVTRLSRTFRGSGVFAALDCAALGPEDLTLASPWLIKPNRAEALDLLRSAGINTDGMKPEAIAAALLSYSDNVLLSLGGDGALFADRISGKIISMPAVSLPRCYSTVGAGDNLLAGFLHFVLTECGAGFDPVLHAGGALSRALHFAAEQCGTPR